jgi:putative tricarboxylic transport membrane protein
VNLLDQFSGLFWLAVSLLVVFGGVPVRGSIGTFHYPGPGFFPFWSGVGLGILSIVLFVKSSLTKTAEGRIGDPFIGKAWRIVIWVTTSLFLYAILLPKIGYLITTFGLMILLLGLMERMRLWVRALAALLIASITYVIFNIWLKSQLPDGILGFYF